MKKKTKERKEGGNIDFSRAARARPKRIWGGPAELNGPAGPRRPKRARARGREEREGRWTGLTTRGPGWDPLVGGSAHRERGARGVLGFGEGRRGACARFAEDAVRRAHAQPHGSRWNARTGRD